MSKEEFYSYIKKGIIHLVALEAKNRWDLFINDFGLDIFIDYVFAYADELPYYSNEASELKEIRALCIEKAQERDVATIQNQLRDKKDKHVYEYVIEIIDEVANELF